MRLSTRHLSVILPLLAACATSQGETTGNSASAVNPEQSINSVSYTVSLTSVHVTAENDIQGGQFVEYAALGASVQPFGADSNAVVENPIQGCTLGPAPLGATLAACTATTSNGGPTGSLLTQTVTLHSETDTANIGVALENIENTPVTAISDNLSTDLGLATTVLKTVGTIATFAGQPEIGGALATVATVISYIPTTPPPNETPCTGGLIAAPSSGTHPYDTMYLSFTGAQLEALTNSTGTGSITIGTPVAVNWTSALPGDTAGMCDSSHMINVTVSRVQGTGPAADPLSASTGVARTGTEFDSVVADSAQQTMANMQWTTNGWSATAVAPSIYAPGAYAPTATMSRQVPPLIEGPWSLVPGPLLLVPGTATTPGTTNLQGTVDSFWFDAVGTLWWTDWQQARGWSTDRIAVGAGVPDSRIAGTSRTPNNLDVFWVNASGSLMNAGVNSLGDVVAPNLVASGVAPKQAGVAAVSRTYNTMDVLYIGNNGGLYDSSVTIGSAWAAPKLIGTAGIAPAGAYITAVARDANTIDAFFIGSNGDVYQAHYANAATGGSTIGWSAPVAIAGLTGTAGGPLSAVSRTQATLDLAYDDSSVLEFAEFNATGSLAWGAPTSMKAPGILNPDTDLSLVARDAQDLAVYYRDAFNLQRAGTWNQTAAVWQFAWPALPSWKWAGWDTLNGGLVTDPTLASPNPSELVAAATGPDGTIWYEMYDSAGLGTWSGWHSLGNRGNKLADAPAMVAVNGKLEIFVRDPVTQHLLHQEAICESTTSCFAPVWNSAGWEDLFNELTPTTIIAGQPTVVVSQPNNQINVFATGTDASAHVIMGTGYGLMGPEYLYDYGPSGIGTKILVGDGVWTNLSGGVLYQPGAASWGPDRLDVFVTGANYQLYHRYSNDNGVTWYPANGGWEDVGGATNGPPSVVSWGPNRLDAVVQGYSGVVQHVAWNGSAWGWDSIPGSSGVRPTAIAHGVGMIDVFGSNGGLYTASIVGSGTPATWSAWSAMAPCDNNGAAALVSRDGTNIDLVMTSYAANGDAAVWHTSTTGPFANQGLSEPPTCQ